MTTKPSNQTAGQTAGWFRLPDPPEGTPEDMTSFNQTNITGNTHHLIQYLGNQDTTLVAGEHYLSRIHPRDMSGVRYPDLIIAFDVNPAAYYHSNAYIISEQGKPPDFVLEIASRRTGRVDVEKKPGEYAALGIPEYWRFDETGDFHKTKLAGDRLIDGRYEPIPIEEIGEGVLQGYSAVLNLLIRWDHGQLRWHDPQTGDHIPTFEQERAGRLAEREGRLAEQERRSMAEARAREAEARVRELEAEIARRDEAI